MSLGYALTQNSHPNHKVVFLGDTRYLPSFKDVVRGATWLVANTNFAGDEAERAAEHGHMTTLQAAVLAQAAGIECLFLQHLSPRYAKRREELLTEARSVFSETKLVEDLQEVR